MCAAVCHVLLNPFIIEWRLFLLLRIVRSIKTLLLVSQVTAFTNLREALLNICTDHASPPISSWARQNNTLVTASGLDKNITLMSMESWRKLEENSKVIEQCEKIDNLHGKALQLLPAIMAYLCSQSLANILAIAKHC
jgi:hypothetical protein